jgi:hypothetical protein
VAQMDETMGYVVSKYFCFLCQIGMVRQARPRRDDETPQGLASLVVVSPVISPWRRYLYIYKYNLFIYIFIGSLAYPTSHTLHRGDLFCSWCLTVMSERRPFAAQKGQFGQRKTARPCSRNAVTSTASSCRTAAGKVRRQEGAGWDVEMQRQSKRPSLDPVA